MHRFYGLLLATTEIMPLWVKRYMLRTNPMAKVIVEFGYDKAYVMEADKALTLLDLLKDAEVYKETWRSSDKGGNTFHIYPQEKELCSMKVLSSNMYSMARLAGKPETN